MVPALELAKKHENNFSNFYEELAEMYVQDREMCSQPLPKRVKKQSVGDEDYQETMSLDDLQHPRSSKTQNS